MKSAGKYVVTYKPQGQVNWQQVDAKVEKTGQEFQTKPSNYWTLSAENQWTSIKRGKIGVSQVTTGVWLVSSCAIISQSQSSVLTSSQLRTALQFMTSSASWASLVRYSCTSWRHSFKEKENLSETSKANERTNKQTLTWAIHVAASG